MNVTTISATVHADDLIAPEAVNDTDSLASGERYAILCREAIQRAYPDADVEIRVLHGVSGITPDTYVGYATDEESIAAMASGDDQREADNIHSIMEVIFANGDWPVAAAGGGMKVWFIPLSGIDPADEDPHEHIDRYCIPGTLTTDHAASSYGLPVIVGEDSTAYGPGDVYDSGYAGDPDAPRNTALETAAASAGWQRERNYGETDATY